MSVIIKLICMNCKTSVHIGSNNSRTVEDPDKVGKFIWKHKNCDMSTICDSSDWYYKGWPEDTDLDGDVI